MNKNFENYGFLIGFFIFLTITAYGQKEKNVDTIVMQKNEEVQVDTDQAAQSKPKTKKEMAKIALKNGLFAVIGDYYQIEPELLLLPKMAFMILVSYAAGRYYAENPEHSYPIKSFIVTNLLAGGVNGVIMSAGAAIVAVPFDRCIAFLTEKTGFFSRGLNSILLKKWSLFFNNNGSYQFKYFVEFFKDRNSYSIKYFLKKLARGVVYTGQIIAQSIVGSLLGQHCTFK